MAHHTLKTGSYEKLAERLNRFSQGAPPSALLYGILEMLFSAREAELVSLLPIRPFSLEKAARAWKMPWHEARKQLDALADRAILLDYLDKEGRRSYVLPPPMAGFFEFSMMRVRGDLDQKLLAELFYEYLNVEEEFIRELFARGETQLGRVFVQERVLSPENALHVLDYERASEAIRGASHIGVGACYCRHKMRHLDRACDAPLEFCMTLNNTAASLIRHGVAREIDAAECLDFVAEAQDRNLVQFGENIRERVNFICNCCGCCCEALLAARRFGHLNPVHTTNFVPGTDAAKCLGCGRCVEACPVDAMRPGTGNGGGAGKGKKAQLDEEVCLGCGICVRVCSAKALALESRPERVLTPMNSMHRAVLMAIERGTLQHLIFDSQSAFGHRALAAVLGAILKLPPLKQAMASKQVKSRYLESLLARFPDERFVPSQGDAVRQS